MQYKTYGSVVKQHYFIVIIQH